MKNLNTYENMNGLGFFGPAPAYMIWLEEKFGQKVGRSIGAIFFPGYLVWEGTSNYIGRNLGYAGSLGVTALGAYWAYKLYSKGNLKSKYVQTATSAWITLVGLSSIPIVNKINEQKKLAEINREQAAIRQVPRGGFLDERVDN